MSFYKRAAVFAGIFLLAQAAYAGAGFDTLQKDVEHKLAVAEARSSISQSELLALRARFNSLVKQNAAAHNTNLKNNPSLLSQLQDIDRRLDGANQRSLASVFFRFF